MENLINFLEKKIYSSAQREILDHMILDHFIFSFPEEFRVVATPPNFYQNRVPLLNIKEGTHDKSKHQTFRFFLKKARAVGRHLWPSRGSGGMLPWKMFKIMDPRLAKNAFPENSAWKN